VNGYNQTTALIVVDVQNDFADPEGSLFVSGAPRVLGFINDQMRVARAGKAPIVRTQDWHPESTPHFAKDGGIWPVHCVADTWGSEFHPGLMELGTIIRKGVDGEDGYSGFSVRDPETGETTSTGLDSILSDAEVTHVVVVGLATDYCVNATALDAVRYGFGCTVLADGIAAVNLEPGDEARACAAMALAGVVIA
jgi:nicotinamidase/pyrazinamidase